MLATELLACGGGWPRALGRRHGPADCCRATPERIIGHVARLSLTPTSHRRLDGLAARSNKAFDGSRRDTGLLGGLAPEITPVSQPNSSPSSVAMIVSLARKRLGSGLRSLRMRRGYGVEPRVPFA